MASVIAQEGSLPEDEARRLFAELCARGDRLAQTDVVAEPASGTVPNEIASRRSQ